MSLHDLGTLEVPEWPWQQCIVGAARRFAGIWGKGLCLPGQPGPVPECHTDALSLESDWLSRPFLLPSLFSYSSQDQSRTEAHWSPKGELIHASEMKHLGSFTNGPYTASFEAPNHTSPGIVFSSLSLSFFFQIQKPQTGGHVSKKSLIIGLSVETAPPPLFLMLHA